MQDVYLPCWLRVAQLDFKYYADYLGHFIQLLGAIFASWKPRGAHTRRKFKEAEAVLSVKQEDSKIAWALKHIQKLYRIEKQIKELSPSDKQAYREEYAKPLLDEYKQWLDNTILQVLPKSALGKAIAYSIRQWPHLVKYIDDGRLAIDNNRSERAIKPFVIGRKNWLFANTVNGANASATIYSIIETAKANNLVPFKYLQFLLEKLTTGDKEINIDDLLPWNVKLWLGIW